MKAAELVETWAVVGIVDSSCDRLRTVGPPQEDVLARMTCETECESCGVMRTRLVETVPADPAHRAAWVRSRGGGGPAVEHVYECESCGVMSEVAEYVPQA